LTDGSTAGPSRWLLWLTIAVVVVMTVLRFMTAATLDLRSDEAYYWTWSHEWVLSYLDQPPMVAWFERLGETVFGDTPLGARFAQLLALPLIELLLADIARRRTRSWNAALFVVLAIECTLDYGFFAIVVEPSVPLLLFTSLLLWALCRLDETLDARWWLLVGVAGGLALLSKYMIVLLAPALLLFLLLPRHRHWLRSRWPYAAVAIALLLFSPVVVWNARHGWASFAFQGPRLDLAGAVTPALTGRFLGYEILFVGAVLFVAAIAGSIALLIRAIRRRQAFELTIAVAFLFPFGFLLVRSFTLLINQSWMWFVWPLGILALALVLPWDGARRRVAALTVAIAVFGLMLPGVFFGFALSGVSSGLGPGDPLGQDAGYAEMSRDVLARAKSAGASWIAATDYRTYANLQFHIGKDIPVLQINQRARFLDFAPRDPALFTGRALYVYLPGAPAVAIEGQRTSLGTLPVLWRGEVMQQVALETLDGFTPQLDPPPGSPAYTWN
jgi:4-amino-4-deoxy-L-arabinose transferase-like glycosyltransferase